MPNCEQQDQAQVWRANLACSGLKNDYRLGHSSTAKAEDRYTRAHYVAEYGPEPNPTREPGDSDPIAKPHKNAKIKAMSAKRALDLVKNASSKKND